jgi:pimeloyl-ACP methyl ester carboxylesterase
MRDASATLPDGRTLAYTDLGASTGRTIMYFHGAPSTRLDLAVFAEALVALDVRVVAADRPGYGGSSPQAGRRREMWPADVAALADQLDIERFAVLGLSSGGPYALACAALLPDRVAAAGTVGGETDFGWPGAWDDYPENEGTLMRIADEAHGIAWCEERYGTDGSGFMEGDMGGLAPADYAALGDEAFAAALTATMREAFRQGVAGYAQDVVLQGRPWSFDPGAIVAPVWVHHGEADTLTPIAHARHTAELIPGARLVTWPAEGHISLIKKIPDLTRELVAFLR